MIARKPARTLFLFAAIAMILALLAVSSPGQAFANNPNPNPGATWAAWHVDLTFAQNQPQIIYTAYVGSDNPQPVVLDETVIDITQDCTVQGSLSYFGDRAYFDGSSHIECDLPNWRVLVADMAPHLRMAQEPECLCQIGGAPLWGAADIRLAPGARQNPVFAVPDTAMEFAMPTIGGGQLRAQMFVDGTFYDSPAANMQPALDQFLAGMYGPGIVAAANHFSWLDFMPNANWQSFFETDVTGARMGYWRGSTDGNTYETAGDYRLKTAPTTIYIGHNPLTGEYLQGVLKAGEFDPGCRAH